MMPSATSSRKTPQPILPKDGERAMGFVNDDNADASVLCDANGVVVAWSGGAETLFGWSAREAVGTSVAELIVPPQHRSAVARDMEQFYRDGDHSCLERHIKAVLLHKDRRIVRVEYLISPIFLKERRYFSVCIWNSA